MSDNNILNPLGDSLRDATISLGNILYDTVHEIVRMTSGYESKYIKEKKFALLEALADEDERERTRQEKIDNFNRINLIERHNKIEIEGEEIDFTNLWINIGLKNKHKEVPILIKYKVTDIAMIFTFELPTGVAESMIRDKVEEIAIFFEVTENNILIKKYKNKIDLVVLVKDIYTETYKYTKDICRSSKGLTVPLGYYLNDSYAMELLTLDMSKDGNHAMLISGTSCSGKSSILRVILAHLVMNYTEKQVELTVLAGSGDTDFLFLENSKHLQDNKIYLNIDEIVGEPKTKYKDKYKTEVLVEAYDGILDTLQKDIEGRLREFSSKKVKDIEEYHKKGYKMPYRVIVFDEYSYFATNEEKFKRLQLVMGSIAQTGRKVGYKVIISLQDAQNMYYTPAIKYNTPIKIGLKAMNENHSKNICDRTGLEDLCNVGEAKLYSAFNMPVGRDCYHFKGLLIDKDNSRVEEMIEKATK